MSEQKMNVYQKLLKARADFLAAKVKKSGKNQRFDYFELDDIVPVATRIFSEVGLLPVVCFDGDLATMQVVDTDCPESYITFTSPVVQLNQNGMNAVQALGATETYQRRYLYYMALDICEPDALDRDQPQQKKKPAESRIIKPAQVEEICKMAVRDAGVNAEKFLPWVAKAFKKPLDKMNDDEAANVVAWINAQAEKRKAKNE